MYKVKGKPWDYSGAINVEQYKTAADVISAAGLNWNVAKCKLVAKMEHIDSPSVNGFEFGGNQYVECPNAYGTYRTDYNIPLGIVKERYTPVQNNEAFNFFNDCIGKDRAIWQTAGFFGNGERIFVSAKLPNDILVKGDPVENYLVFTNSHDGTSGVKILFTPIRVICQNTLNAAIKTTTNYISFRHTSSVHDNINIAGEILGICKERTELVKEQFNFLANKKMSDIDAVNLFGDIIFTEKEKETIKLTGHTVNQIATRNWIAINDTQISAKKVNAIAEMNNYYFSGVGQREIVGTAWGVINAVSGYYSNVDNNKDTKRMDTLLYGDRANKIALATNLLIAA